MNVSIERILQYLGEEVVKRRLLEDQVAQLQEAVRARSENQPERQRGDQGEKEAGDQGSET